MKKSFNFEEVWPSKASAPNNRTTSVESSEFFLSMNSRREDMEGNFTENYAEKNASYKQNYQVMLFLQLKLFLLCGSECNVV